MASNEKTRYKAIIADHTYTIIGQESKQHMDLVTKIVNEQKLVPYQFAEKDV